MEDYLRQFRLGPHTAGLAWLDCGSGADGLDAGVGPGTGRRARAQRAGTGRGPVPGGAGHHRPPGDAPRGLAAVGGGGVPPAAAVAGPAGAAVRSAASGRRGGRGLHLRPAVAALGRPARRGPAEPAAQTAAGLRDHRHLRSVSDAELGSALLEVAAIARAVGGRRDLVSVLPCDAAARVVHPLCRAEGIPLVGGGGTDLRTGFARALRAAAPPGRHRGPDRRPDALAAAAAVPDGGRPVPPAPGAWREEVRPAYRERHRPGRGW